MTIRTVFKRELSTYLRSPVGYIVAALLLFIDGVLFQWILSSPKPRVSAEVLRLYFAWTGGLVLVAGLVLSARLIAEERARKTIVLYRTSPAKDWQVILGKYLAVLFFLTCVILLTLYIPLLIDGKFSTGQIVIGYVGMFMIGAVALAIGMFASALSPNILVALFLSVAICVILCLLHPMAKNLDPPLNDVGAMLDMWWVRYELGTAKGLLTLSNVVYYFSLVYLFLLLATKTMEAKRWR